MAQAKAKPGMPVMDAGRGATQTMIQMVLEDAEKVTFTHIPYRGGVSYVPDIISGTLSGGVIPLNVGLGLVKNGDLKALAITSAKRSVLLPSVPTVAETVPNYESDIWIGMIASAKTPPAIINKLNAELRRSLALPDVREKLAEQGIYVESSSAAEFTRLIAADQKRWAAVIKSANIVPE